MSAPAPSPVAVELLQWPPMGGGPHTGRRASSVTARARVLSSEAAFAAAILSGALACVYAIAGATLVGTAPRSGALLLAIAGAQALLAIAVARGTGRRVLLVVAAAQLLLAGAWLASRSVGLPLSGATHPVRLLDALVATDELLVALLAVGIAGRARLVPLLVELALVLAAVSLTALATGHTHAAPTAHLPAGAPAPAAKRIYCKLL